MKKTILSAFTVLLLVLLPACFSPAKEAASPTVAQEGASPHHHDTEEKDTWTCGMHPQIKKDKAGQCPICGMNLVKVEKESQEIKGSVDLMNQPPKNHAVFSLSPLKQQMIGVKFGFVEKKPLFKSIRAAGRLAFDPELYTAQNDYVEALKQLERVRDSALPDVRHSAERMVHSAKLRLKILGLSDQQIGRMRSSQDFNSDLVIHKPGGQVWVYADIYEMDLPQIQSGQSVEITARFLGGKTLLGKVASVDRVINPSTRTAKARILVKEATTLLRPESYVDVKILSPLGEQVSVPFDAVLDTGEESWIFTVDDQNRFYPRLVTVKYQAGEEVAIGSGLKGGEKIVTSANFLIDSESRLKWVSQSLTTGDKVLPACPKEQHWDVPMSMCMPN